MTKMGSTPKNISGSRAAAILGLSNFSTPIDIWLQIMEEREPGFCMANNFEKPEWKDAAVLRWGLAFENSICDIASLIQRRNIIDKEREYSLRDGLVTCHIDGMYEGSNKLHEGKTTSSFIYRDKWGEPGSDMIPKEYQVQVQHQMMCAKKDVNIVSVLVFPNRVDDWEEAGIEVKENANFRGQWNIYFDNGSFVDTSTWTQVLYQMGYFHQYIVEANKALQELMLQTYMNWWEEHVVKKQMPEASNYSDIKKLIRAPSGTIVATEELESLSAEYKAITAESSEINKRKEHLKTLIINHMNQSAKAEDKESADKYILRAPNGKKLHSYNGKVFR